MLRLLACAAGGLLAAVTRIGRRRITRSGTNLAETGGASATARRGKTPESEVSEIKELPGKAAKISAATRGQRRSRAVRRATEGAGIITLDVCPDIPTVQSVWMPVG
jgi:hypothetical protein